MLVSYYLPGNSCAHPPSHRANGTTAHTEGVQAIWGMCSPPPPPIPYGRWPGGWAWWLVILSHPSRAGGGWDIKPRSLKSTTTATMVGGPNEFGGTKGMFTVFFWVYLGDSFGPPRIFIPSPQIQFMVPQKSLFCPLLITIHCSPTKIIVMSPQIPLILHKIPFIVHQKYCFVPS